VRAAADERLLTTDLAAWAGVRVAGAGRRDALLGRVDRLRLSVDGRAVEARVRGAGAVPFRVHVASRAGGLEAACSCRASAGRPCGHAVAMLEALRFPVAAPSGGRRAPRRGGGRARAGRGRIVQHAPPPPGWIVLGTGDALRSREQRLAAAAEEQIAALRRRARRWRVRRGPDGPPAGVEVVSATGAAHTVVARGADGRLLCCTCADFAVNELGTCEHVERARRSRLLRQALARTAAAGSRPSISWQPRAWIDRRPVPLAEVRLDAPADHALPPALAAEFDTQGFLAPDGEGQVRPERVQRVLGLARRAGLSLDLDPAVPALAAQARRERRLQSLRARAAEDPELWSRTVAGLGVRLHRYQEAGVRFLARAGRAFLADDMGLGKTIQAIAAALLLRGAAGARRALVVCPAALKHQWMREIERVAGERALIAEGPAAARRSVYRRWREGFLIVNYELLLRDPLRHLAAADLVVLDEAQRIKNWTTRTAQAVKRLRGAHAFVLTGTPLENRLGELHSIVEFLHPRAAGPRWRLLPLHLVQDARGRAVAYEALDLLRRRLAALFLRRERDAVQHELPARTDNTYWTELGRMQRGPYRRHAAAVAALLARPGPLSARHTRALLAALTSMRVLCNGAGQQRWRRFAGRVDGPPPTRAELRALGSPKLEEFARVIEDLLDEPERKIVVFSQWERMLRLARWVAAEALSRRGLRAGLFCGGLNSAARERLLEQFAADPQLRVLFSTDAGGVGLNLQAASIVVQLEVPWNPAVLEQRIGRVHRLGQRRTVHVLHFVTRGAIEERVRQVVESKRALFAGLLVDGQDAVVLDPRAGATLVERLREVVGP